MTKPKNCRFYWTVNATLVYQDIKKCQHHECQYTKTEKNKGRIEQRIVRIYTNTLEPANQKKWTSVRSLIEVTRVITTKGKTTTETAYFISDLPPQIGAHYFYKGIRSHWQIETFHYIKDITFGEDHWKVRTKNAPANYSLIRNIAINLFRQHGLHHIQAAIERCANNVPFMMTLL